MEKRDLVEEAKDFITKAKRLKSEFEILPYSERLKYMDKEFRGASSIYDSQEQGEKPILSVWPVGEEQIRLYNEWKIRLFESMEPASSFDFSFERLKKGFEDHILDVKKEKHPELSITKYTQEQISLYKEKVQSSYVQLQWKEFGGAWDITKKVIINLGPFLKARAFYNYISFLENMPDIEQDTIIDKIYLIHFYRQFQSFFPDEKQETWLQRFVYPSSTLIDPIKVESRVKGENNRLILLTLLAEIYKCPHPNFIYKDFVLARFGIKGYDKAISIHKDRPEYKKYSIICRQILKI